MPLTKIEYRVRPVTRYVVTRYCERSDDSGEPVCASSEARGEFDNADRAHDVAYALCRSEHEQLGWPAGDERILYPLAVDQ